MGERGTDPYILNLSIRCCLCVHKVKDNLWNTWYHLLFCTVDGPICHHILQ